MASIGQTSALRNRKWRHGTVLTITQTARLINFPLAQDIAHHVQQLVVALKAPKDNDMEAQELADRIGELLDFLDGTVEEITSGCVLDTSGNIARYLVELQHLRDNLERSFSTLQTIHKFRYTTKLASQTQIRDSIHHKKDQLLQTRFDLLTCLTMFMLTTIAQTSQAFDLLAESHEATCERLKRLERRFDAVLLTRQTDERGWGPVACFVLEKGRLIFFFSSDEQPAVPHAENPPSRTSDSPRGAGHPSLIWS